MSPELSPDQRQALDEQQGKPIYVVDRDRQQTFVLLSLGDYQWIRDLLDDVQTDEEWTDEKNARRCHLIDKEIESSFSSEEKIELVKLEWLANRHFDEVAPPPMKNAQQLHQQLLKASDAE